MRPKKPILIWSEDGEAARDLAYPLSLTWYRPLVAVATTELLDALRGQEIHLAVVFASGYDAGGIVAAMVKAAQPSCPVLVLSEKPFDVTVVPAMDQQRSTREPRQAIFEMIRIMSARKKGPKKLSEQPWYREMQARGQRLPVQPEPATRSCLDQSGQRPA